VSRHRHLTSLIAVFLLGIPVLAATISWNGGSANWSPGNWNPSLPGSGDDVQIASGVAGGDSVFLNINTTINSLLLGNTNGSMLSTTSTQTLTINTSLTINNLGTLDFASASTLNVNGAVTNTVHAGGVLEFTGGSTLNMTGSLDNSGTVITNPFNSGGAANMLNVNGTFTNEAGATLDVGHNDNTLDVSNIGTLTNSGFVRVGHGAALNLTNALASTSIVSGASYLINGSFNQGAGTNNALGSLNTISGSLQIGNGVTQTITPSGGTLTVNNTGSLDLQSTQAWGGTTLTLSGNVTNAGFVGTNILNSENGTVASTLNVTGTFTNQSGATLDIGHNDNTIDVANIGTLSNSGSVRIGHGAAVNLTNALSTTIVSGASYLINGNFNQGAGTNNALGSVNSINGSLQIGNGTSQTITPAGGTLTVGSTGSLDLQSTQAWGGTTLTISGNVVNAGLVSTNITNGENGTVASTLTVTGTFTNQAGATLDAGHNGNTIDVVSTPELDNAGTVFVRSAAGLFFVGTGTPSGAGYVQNAGGVLGEDLSSGTSFGVINVTGNVSLAGTLNVTLLNGFDPAAGNPAAHFIFLTYSGVRTGTFLFSNPLFDNGTEQWFLTYDDANKDVFLSFQPAGVPEPASLVLTAGGLLTLAFARRRKRSRR
jgi:fibronectin-binding autotransporter adhesin